jgi:hypothetical protein
VDGPARPRQGDAQRGPDRTGTDDPDDRRLAGRGMHVRVDVVARVDLVAVAMCAGRGRVEVEPGLADRRLRLGAVAFRIVARQVAPGLHRSSCAFIRRV